MTKSHDPAPYHSSNFQPDGMVSIMMCTFNGGSFIEAQLESILAQSHQDWILYISDDGSTDNTLDIIERFRSQVEPWRIILREGPGLGFAQNFLFIAQSIDLPTAYYAFCDQDDIWHSDHLTRGIRGISNYSDDKPLLYCGRTRLIDAFGRHLGFSPLFSKKPSFSNALVQSIAGGNTMVFNAESMRVFCKIGLGSPIVSHDWLLYQVVSGCSGVVVYDPVPSVEYRQHSRNLIGSNSSFANRVDRFKMLLGGRFRDWNRDNISVISSGGLGLSSESRRKVEDFSRIRSCSSLLMRVLLLCRSGLYRQTLFGQAGLFLAVFIKRI